MKTEMRFVKLLHTTYRSALNAVFSIPVHKLWPKGLPWVLLWVGSFYVMEQKIQWRIAFFLCHCWLFHRTHWSFGSCQCANSKCLIAADRLFEIMDLENEVKGQTSPLTKVQLGDIVFKEVSFRYGSRKEVFDQFSARFPFGKVTAIVGRVVLGNLLWWVCCKNYIHSTTELFLLESKIFNT